MIQSKPWRPSSRHTVCGAESCGETTFGCEELCHDVLNCLEEGIGRCLSPQELADLKDCLAQGVEGSGNCADVIGNPSFDSSRVIAGCDCCNEVGGGISAWNCGGETLHCECGDDETSVCDRLLQFLQDSEVCDPEVNGSEPTWARLKSLLCAFAAACPSTDPCRVLFGEEEGCWGRVVEMYSHLFAGETPEITSCQAALELMLCVRCGCGDGGDPSDICFRIGLFLDFLIGCGERPAGDPPSDEALLEWLAEMVCAYLAVCETPEPCEILLGGDAPCIIELAERVAAQIELAHPGSIRIFFDRVIDCLECEELPTPGIPPDQRDSEGEQSAECSVPRPDGDDCPEDCGDPETTDGGAAGAGPLTATPARQRTRHVPRRSCCSTGISTTPNRTGMDGSTPSSSCASRTSACRW